MGAAVLQKIQPGRPLYGFRADHFRLFKLRDLDVDPIHLGKKMPHQ
jgi:hypothetical protein